MSCTSAMPSALAHKKNAAAPVPMTSARLAHLGQNGCTAQSASRKCAPAHQIASSTAEASATFASSDNMARDSSRASCPRISA